MILNLSRISLRAGIAAAVYASAASLAFAGGSSINPAIPAQNAPLSSAPVRGNFQAAYNDINSILGMFNGASSPTSYTKFQLWANTTMNPVVLSIFDGSAWVPWGQLNTSTHVFMPNISSSSIVGTSPVHVSVVSDVATVSLNFDSNFAVVSNNLALASVAAGDVVGNAASSGSAEPAGAPLVNFFDANFAAYSNKVGLAYIPTGYVIGNATGSSAEPTGTSASAFFSSGICSHNGSLALRYAGTWGCSGQITGFSQFTASQAVMINANASLTIPQPGGSGSPNLFSPLLDVVADDNDGPVVFVGSYGTAYPAVVLSQVMGTAASPSATTGVTTSGLSMGGYAVAGYGATQSLPVTAGIFFYAGATFTDHAAPTGIDFFVSPTTRDIQNVSDDLQLAMTILPTGEIDAGGQIFSPSAQLFSSLPTADAGTVFQIGNLAGTVTRFEATAVAASSTFTGRRADGTYASPTALVNADLIAALNAHGYDGASWSSLVAGAFRVYAEGTWSSASHPTEACASTTPAGSTTIADLFCVHNDTRITALLNSQTTGFTGLFTISAASSAHALYPLSGGSTAEIPTLWLSGPDCMNFGGSCAEPGDTILLLDAYGIGATPAIILSKSGGTWTAPDATGSANVLGDIESTGFYAGTPPVRTAQSAAIQFLSAAAFTSSSWPTAINFYTTPTGSTTPVEVLSLDSSGTIIELLPGLGTTATAGISLKNMTAATASVTQLSPSLVLTGQGWSTTSVASQTVQEWITMAPILGATNPSGTLQISHSINGGGLTLDASLTSGGVFSATTGFEIGGAAPTVGHYLRSNGSIFVDGTIQSGDLPGTLYGGSAAGATLSLISTSNGSPSGDSIINDATTHLFKNAAGSTTWLTVSSSGIVAAATVITSVANGGNYGLRFQNSSAANDAAVTESSANNLVITIGASNELFFNTSAPTTIMDYGGTNAGAWTIAGHVYMTGLTVGSGSAALCLTGGQIESDASSTICGISALRYKNLIEEISPTRGLLGVLSLRGESYTYKEGTPGHADDERVYVSLIADDMSAMNHDCAEYSKAGVENYMDRCFEAYQVASDKKLWQLISALAGRLPKNDPLRAEVDELRADHR